MCKGEKGIFEDTDICGVMKNTQTTPYVFVRNAYAAMQLKNYATAKLWLEHAGKFTDFFDDNPRELENFRAVLYMALDLLTITQMR